jgi:hypothetical protein
MDPAFGLREAKGKTLTHMETKEPISLFDFYAFDLLMCDHRNWWHFGARDICLIYVHIYFVTYLVNSYKVWDKLFIFACYPKPQSYGVPCLACHFFFK